MGNCTMDLMQTKVFHAKYHFLFIGNLHAHLVGFEPTTTPSTLLLQRKEMPFELELKYFIVITEIK